MNFSRDSLAYPVVWPRAIGAAAYANFQVRLSSLSPDGRYFFGLATRHSIDSRCYIIRYDLLSADSLDFVAKAALIDLDTILNYPYVQDMRVGPDNNLYFSILESPMLNNSGNRRIARILNACEPDTSLISVQLNFATRPVLSVYQSFPTLSSNQTLPRPFQLITNCSDSVQFQFNLKNVPDSVWWDFGAPVLGSVLAERAGAGMEGAALPAAVAANAALEARLEALQDALRADVLGGAGTEWEVLLEGAGGTTFAYDFWRRVKGVLQGRRVQENHAEV